MQSGVCLEVGQAKGEVTYLRSLARKWQGWESHGGGGSGLSPHRKEPVVMVTVDGRTATAPHPTPKECMLWKETLHEPVPEGPPS